MLRGAALCMLGQARGFSVHASLTSQWYLVTVHPPCFMASRALSQGAFSNTVRERCSECRYAQLARTKPSWRRVMHTQAAPYCAGAGDRQGWRRPKCLWPCRWVVDAHSSVWPAGWRARIKACQDAQGEEAFLQAPSRVTQQTLNQQLIATAPQLHHFLQALRSPSWYR